MTESRSATEILDRVQDGLAGRDHPEDPQTFPTSEAGWLWTFTHPAEIAFEAGDEPLPLEAALRGGLAR